METSTSISEGKRPCETTYRLLQLFHKCRCKYRVRPCSEFFLHSFHKKLTENDRNGKTERRKSYCCASCTQTYMVEKCFLG